MAIDQEKWIGAQAVVKSIIESLPQIEDNNKFYGILRARFDHAIKIMEEYATINPDDEWINTGVRVPKAYWDTRNEELIMEGNRPMKTEKGWFIHTQKKRIQEFKKFIDGHEEE